MCLVLLWLLGEFNRCFHSLLSQNPSKAGHTALLAILGVATESQRFHNCSSPPGASCGGGAGGGIWCLDSITSVPPPTTTTRVSDIGEDDSTCLHLSIPPSFLGCSLVSYHSPCNYPSQAQCKVKGSSLINGFSVTFAS